MSANVPPWGPLPVAVAFALGIALAGALGQQSPAWWMLAAALALICVRIRPDRTTVRLVIGTCAVIAIGLGRGSALPARSPGSVVPDDRIVDRAVGSIAGPVMTTRDGGSGARLVTDDGELWLWSSRRLLAGQRVEVSGYAGTRVDAFGGRSQGLEMRVDALRVTHDDPDVGARAWRWAARVQQSWARAIDEAGGDPGARAALRGIVAGDRSAISPALDERFRATGIFHVLSVSGLHLAVVAGLVFALFRRLVAASPLGRRCNPARWSAPPALAIAIAYTMITGAQIATMRALVVVALVLVAAMAARPLRLRDAIGTAAIAILWVRPHDISDPSFQLSFTAALALALLLPPTPAPASSRTERIARGAWRSMVASAWVTLATSPLTALHFQLVAPGGILGNLVLAPLLELLALPLGLLGCVTGPFGQPLVRTATEIVGIVDWLAGTVAPAALVGRVAVAVHALAAVLVALSLMLIPTRRRALRVLLLGLLCGGWALARVPAPRGALRVTFLDVGQGDAALVELPDGGAWLIDAGGAPNSRDLTRASRPGQMIDRTLAAAGILRIDLAVLSHPHPDHYLGLAALRTPITQLWFAEEPAHAAPHQGAMPSFADLATVLEGRGTRIVHPPLGLAIQHAGVELVVWGPRYAEHEHGPERCFADPVRTVNDNSLVVELRYRGRSILFAGDLEAEGELAAVAAGLGHVDVVKVAHHGSPTSSTTVFVNATTPAIAVISCGRNNLFGFPAADVVQRWREVGARIARTDTHGSIRVVIMPNGALSVED